MKAVTCGACNAYRKLTDAKGRYHGTGRCDKEKHSYLFTRETIAACDAAKIAISRTHKPEAPIVGDSDDEDFGKYDNLFGRRS